MCPVRPYARRITGGGLRLTSMYRAFAKKLSEAHLAVVSGYGYGGHFVTDNHLYYSLGYGPVDYSAWSTETITENRETDPICDTVYKILVNNVVTDEEKNVAINKMKETIPDYYVLKTTSLPSIQEAKQNYLQNEEEIQETRNIIKQHIINNGALYTSVFPGYVKENSDGQICLYNKNTTFTSHAVAIIGWDDTFARLNFKPELPTPPCDGAWLCLDSDGIRANGSEYLWVSYADYTVESSLYGVLSVHQGKVNLNECDISLSDENIDYNGIEQRPDISLKFEGYTFTNGIDYTVEYRNNINPGTATAVITGINRFTGTIEKHFNIGQNTTINDSMVGDLNNNKIIDIGDTLILYRHIALSNNVSLKSIHPDWELSDEDIQIGDINKNGTIDIGDILKLQRYISAGNTTSVAEKHPDWLVLY